MVFCIMPCRTGGSAAGHACAVGSNSFVIVDRPDEKARTLSLPPRLWPLNACQRTGATYRAMRGPVMPRPSEMTTSTQRFRRSDFRAGNAEIAVTGVSDRLLPRTSIAGTIRRDHGAQSSHAGAAAHCARAAARRRLRHPRVDPTSGARPGGTGRRAARLVLRADERFWHLVGRRDDALASGCRPGAAPADSPANRARRRRDHRAKAPVIARHLI